MESLEFTQPNRRLRAVRLAITVGLAMLFLAALLCGLREVTPAHADPGVRYVDGASGTDTTNCTSPISPCATIGYALDQAEDFDNILVAQGTYTENLVITKTITLEGGYEPDSWSRRLDRYTTIDGDRDQSGEAVIRVESTLSETTVIDGFTITNGDGGIGIGLSSVAIQNCKIVHNHREVWGYGGITIDRSYVTITNTLIADNHDGAMLVLSTPVDPRVTSNVRINSSTIANNGSHGIFCSLSWCIVDNSIVWGHEGEDFAGELGRCLVTYSDIEMMEWPGEGNISEDPRFVDPDNGDYHLQPDSPCIDKGTNENAPLTDWEGDPRPLDGDGDGTAVTDMGADEFKPYQIYLPYVVRSYPEIITVMTYNILDGGGIGPTDPQGEWCCGPPHRRGCCNAPGGNRLPRILEVIKFADPDILGIQEAYLWQLDNQAIAREVAAELGMNYYIGESESPDGAHVVLFTKFDIVEAESYPGYFEAINSRGALHAELVTHSGQPIHTFVVHLKAWDSEMPFLVEEMSAYLDNLTVLLGDMNFVDPSNWASMLREAGWCHPLAEQQGIDQIWTSPALTPHVQPVPPIPTELIVGTSDHTPVVVEIAIYSP